MSVDGVPATEKKYAAKAECTMRKKKNTCGLQPKLHADNLLTHSKLCIDIQGASARTMSRKSNSQKVKKLFVVERWALVVPKQHYSINHTAESQPDSSYKIHERYGGAKHPATSMQTET